jgi:hypothetical protein
VPRTFRDARRNGCKRASRRAPNVPFFPRFAGSFLTRQMSGRGAFVLSFCKPVLAAPARIRSAVSGALQCNRRTIGGQQTTRRA